MPQSYIWTQNLIWCLMSGQTAEAFCCWQQQRGIASRGRNLIVFKGRWSTIHFFLSWWCFASADQLGEKDQTEEGCLPRPRSNNWRDRTVIYISGPTAAGCECSRSLTGTDWHTDCNLFRHSSNWSEQMKAAFEDDFRLKNLSRNHVVCMYVFRCSAYKNHLEKHNGVSLQYSAASKTVFKLSGRRKKNGNNTARKTLEHANLWCESSPGSS